MTDDVVPAALATWAAKNLPARLDVAAAAKRPGIAESDIEILMAVGKLTPPGDPATNAPKWFWGCWLSVPPHSSSTDAATWRAGNDPPELTHGVFPPLCERRLFHIVIEESKTNKK